MQMGSTTRFCVSQIRLLMKVSQPPQLVILSFLPQLPLNSWPSLRYTHTQSSSAALWAHQSNVLFGFCICGWSVAGNYKRFGLREGRFDKNSFELFHQLVTYDTQYLILLTEMLKREDEKYLYPYPQQGNIVKVAQGEEKKNSNSWHKFFSVLYRLQFNYLFS